MIVLLYFSLGNRVRFYFKNKIIIKKEKKYGLIWNNFDNLFTTRVESYIIKLYIKYKKII